MQHLTDRLKVSRTERDKFRFCGREYVQHPPRTVAQCYKHQSCVTFFQFSGRWMSDANERYSLIGSIECTSSFSGVTVLGKVKDDRRVRGVEPATGCLRSNVNTTEPRGGTRFPNPSQLHDESCWSGCRVRRFGLGTVVWERPRKEQTTSVSQRACQLRGLFRRV